MFVLPHEEQAIVRTAEYPPDLDSRHLLSARTNTDATPKLNHRFQRKMSMSLSSSIIMFYLSKQRFAPRVSGAMAAPSQMKLQALTLALIVGHAATMGESGAVCRHTMICRRMLDANPGIMDRSAYNCMAV